MTGTILIEKLALLGYTPETQVYFIQNGGGVGTTNAFNFLKAHTKHFNSTLFCGRVYHALPASRIEKFRTYAESKGFEVKMTS